MTFIPRRLPLATTAFAAVLAAATLSAVPASGYTNEVVLPGVTAATTLTWSVDTPDAVTVSWPRVGNGSGTLDFGPGISTLDGGSSVYVDDAACSSASCTWTGEVEDVYSGGTVTVDVMETLGDLDSDGADDYLVHTGTAQLLPPDTVRPTIAVRIRKRRVRVGRAIRLKVSFKDDQTEFGWFDDECAPGGECYHPDWYPQMSLNRGRTWHWLEESLVSRRPRKVHVWIRWPDEAGNVSATYKSPVLKWKRPKG